MNHSRLKWAAALSLSAFLHAGAAAFFARPDEEIEIEGGQQAGVIVLGNAFEEMAAAGEPVETVEAIQPQPVPVQPVQAAEARAIPVEPVQAMQAQTVPVQAETAVPEAAPVEPAETTAAVVPESSGAVGAEPAEPVQAQETVVALAPVPVPTPRPAYTPPRSAEAVSARPKPRKAAQQATQAGSRGENVRNARRGASDGGASAAEGASARAERRAASADGNAAVSNYPGQIVSKLRRSLRYPAEARRNRVTGEVHVSFVVSANGSTDRIRVVRSSGSPALDQAALETVRRAAPFPAIPREAGRESWAFTVPLAFAR
jgi:protein TonB